MLYPHVCTTLINFINQRFLEDDNSGLSEDTPLLDLGVINSLQTIQLVVFIKKQFSCTIPDEKINLENFQSIDAIAKLIVSMTEEVVA